jgi:hypothetical protein
MAEKANAQPPASEIAEQKIPGNLLDTSRSFGKVDVQ